MKKIFLALATTLSLPNKRKIISLFFLMIFIFFMGAHFKQQEIWPFGQGYYASLKNIKNYGFNYKEILTEEAKKAVNIIDLACFDRSLILNSISQKNVIDFVATCGSEIKKSLATKGIKIDNDQLELISANIVAHNFAPYGKSSAITFEAIVEEKTLNCGNYPLLLAYLIQPNLAKLLRIIGFDGGIVGNHAQVLFDSGSNSMLLDPTVSSVTFVNYDSLFYEENSLREVFVFNRQKDDELNSFYANVDRALSQSLYRPSDILYYYFTYDHMLSNLYRYITPGGFRLYKRTKPL